MNRKFLTRHRSYDDIHSQCIVYRKSEPKTFSTFVDKVIGNLPATISATRTCINPNNPIDVLKAKGLLNISRNAIRTGDCPADVKLNFYSEESRCGDTVKVFSSNHHFKHGKLIYSSTHELLPEIPTGVEKCNEWWENRRRREILDSKDELRAIREVAHNKSARRKLTDIFQDVEKQKIIQRFEREARKRRLYSRSLSPVNLCDITGRNRENYLQTLRSEIIRNQLSPFTMLRRKNASPERFRCHGAAVYKHTPTICHRQQSTCIKSSSDLSISSRQSFIYTSPKKIIEKTSRYEEYKRTSSPKPQFKRDLFVIPAHTCKRPQIDRCRYIKTSHWETLKNCVTSPKLNHQKSPKVWTEKKNSHYERVTRGSKMPYSEYEHRIRKSSIFDSEVKSRKDYKRAFDRQRHISAIKSPLKSILSHKHEIPSSKYSPSRKIRFSESATSKSREKKGWEESDLRHAEKQLHSSHRHKYAGDSRYKHKTLNGKHDKMKYRIKDLPVGGSFRHNAGKHQKLSSTESETESESTSSTFISSSVSDSENERDKMKHHDSASDSKTSVCSLNYDYQNKASSSPKSFQKPTCSQSRSDKKRYKDGTYEHSDISEKKHMKKRRQINPNKVVHLEDSGKRLSQYYTEGKAILDSEKAFEDGEKIGSKKITSVSCSPTRTEFYDSDSHEVTFREESLDNHLRRALLEEHQREENLFQNIVNNRALREYREKYADYSVHSNKKKMLRTSTERNCDEHTLSIKNYSAQRRHGDCEACVIERLLAEEN